MTNHRIKVRVRKETEVKDQQRQGKEVSPNLLHNQRKLPQLTVMRLQVVKQKNNHRKVRQS
jgi:hypothetical protein